MAWCRPWWSRPPPLGEPPDRRVPETATAAYQIRGEPKSWPVRWRSRVIGSETGSDCPETGTVGDVAACVGGRAVYLPPRGSPPGPARATWRSATWSWGARGNRPTSCNPVPISYFRLMSMKFLGPVMGAVMVTGLAADAVAKAKNPLGDDKHDAFVLQATATSSGPVAMLEVQNAITGDVVSGFMRPLHDGQVVFDVSSGSTLRR